jgi:regulator of RNase E activity RraA
VTTSAAIERLAGLDVCLVSDALDRLDLPGAVSGMLPVWAGARTAGVVVTMSVGAANGRRADRHLGAAALEHSGPGSVIVIERRDVPPVLASSWGGLLSLAAVKRDVAGVIVDGPCRDTDEIRSLGLPVFSRGVVPFTARRRVIEEAFGESISIAAVRVAPGDFVVADGSGVAFIASAHLDEVLRVAEELSSREAKMAADLERGLAPSDVLGRNYEEMLDGG